MIRSRAMFILFTLLFSAIQKAAADPELLSLGATSLQRLEASRPKPPIPLKDPDTPDPARLESYYKYLTQLSIASERWKSAEGTRTRNVELKKNLEFTQEAYEITSKLGDEDSSSTANIFIPLIAMLTKQTADAAAEEAGREQEKLVQQLADSVLSGKLAQDGKYQARVESGDDKESAKALSDMVNDDKAISDAIYAAGVPKQVSDALQLKLTEAYKDRLNWLVLSSTDARKTFVHSHEKDMKQTLVITKSLNDLNESIRSLKSYESSQSNTMAGFAATASDEAQLLRDFVEQQKQQNKTTNLFIWERLSVKDQLAALDSGWFPEMPNDDRAHLKTDLEELISQEATVRGLQQARRYIQAGKNLSQLLNPNNDPEEQVLFQSLDTIMAGGVAFASGDYLTSALATMQLFTRGNAVPQSSDAPMLLSLNKQLVQIQQELQSLHADLDRYALEIMEKVGALYAQVTRTSLLLEHFELISPLTSCHAVTILAGSESQSAHLLQINGMSRSSLAKQWQSDMIDCATFIDQIHRISASGAVGAPLWASQSDLQEARDFQDQVYTPTLLLTEAVLNIKAELPKCRDFIYNLLTTSHSLVIYGPDKPLLCNGTLEDRLKQSATRDWSGSPIRPEKVLANYLDPSSLVQIVNAAAFLWPYKELANEIDELNIAKAIAPSWFRGFQDLASVVAAQQAVLRGDLLADNLALWLMDQEKPLGVDFLQNEIRSQNYLYVYQKYFKGLESPPAVRESHYVKLLDQQIAVVNQQTDKNALVDIEADPQCEIAHGSKNTCRKEHVTIGFASSELQRRRAAAVASWNLQYRQEIKDWRHCGIEEFKPGGDKLFAVQVVRCVMSRNPQLAANVATRLMARKFPSKSSRLTYEQGRLAGNAKGIVEAEVGKSSAEITSRPRQPIFHQIECFAPVGIGFRVTADGACVNSVIGSSRDPLSQFDEPPNYVKPEDGAFDFGIDPNAFRQGVGAYLDLTPVLYLAIPYFSGEIDAGDPFWETPRIMLPPLAVIEDNLAIQTLAGQTAFVLLQKVQFLASLFASPTMLGLETGWAPPNSTSASLDVICASSPLEQACSSKP